MIIRPLTILDEQKYNDYMTIWEGAPLIVPHTSDRQYYSSFRHMLECYYNDLIVDTDTHVPAMTHYLFIDGEIAGAVNIRIGLTETLRNRGGNVGYGVSPKYRGRGLAQVLLKHAVAVLGTFGIQEVLVTCDATNIGSQKTIQACGGVAVEPFFKDGHHTMRFVITVEPASVPVAE